MYDRLVAANEYDLELYERAQGLFDAALARSAPCDRSSVAAMNEAAMNEIMGTDENAAVDLMRTCLSPSSFWVPEGMDHRSAWLEHVPFALWLVEALRPRLFIELGTHHGSSYFAFCQAVQRLQLGTRCYAVDTWKGDEHAGFYDDNVYQQVRKHHDHRYSAFSALIRSTFDEALGQFDDGTVDLLHIDGRHFYEDVRHDFESWLPKLSDRGVVLFHDTNVRERNFGVFRLWAELTAVYPHFEFTHGHGLGVVGVGSDLPARLRSLFGASHDQAAAIAIRAAYGRLGSAVTFQLAAEELASARLSVKTLESAADALRADLARQVQENARQVRENARQLQENAEQRAELARQVQENAGQRAELTRKAAESHALESRIQELVANGQELEARLARDSIQLRAMFASTSWRVTTPLRRVAEKAPAAAARLRRMLQPARWT